MIKGSLLVFLSFLCVLLMPFMAKADDYAYALKYCEDGGANTYVYDCECFAQKFSALRAQDPLLPESHIFLKLRDECLSAPNIRAHTEKGCLGNVYLLPAGVEPHAYCTCYAEHFAEKFFELKNPTTMQNQSKAAGYAKAECRPAMPRKTK